jgi:hypothetical protein
MHQLLLPNKALLFSLDEAEAYDLTIGRRAEAGLWKELSSAHSLALLLPPEKRLSPCRMCRWALLHDDPQARRASGVRSQVPLALH